MRERMENEKKVGKEGTGEGEGKREVVNEQGVGNWSCWCRDWGSDFSF